MLQVELTASARKETGKGAMRQLRMNGKTPAVVYGAGNESMAVQLDTGPFFQQLLNFQGMNAIITLKLDDGSTKHVLVQDIQTDPVKDTLVHADFLEIDVKKTRQFGVQVNYTGTAKGCDLGGILNIIKHSLVIEGKPLDIPDEFVVDVTELNIGDRIQVEAISIPDGVTLMDSLEDVCVSVSAPGKAEEAAEEGEEEEAAEGAETPAEAAEGAGEEAQTDE